MKYMLVSIILFTLTYSNTFSQIHQINGEIYSFDGSPLNYVSILLAGTGNGTVSKEDGSFSLAGNLTEESLINFSRIGYEDLQMSVRDILSSHHIYMKNKIVTSQTILVKGSIGVSGVTPIAFSKLSGTSIKQNYVDQDIPEILSTQPSVTFYSENGNGIGYNYLSIRGFDQRRILVSINGIPQNDPEDHNVYWLDFPDLLASTELIQVQRGAGSGMMSYPAVGGSINIITSTFPDKSNFEISSSVGSYNTRKYSAQFSSGLVKNKYSFYAKVSHTMSGGYRNSSWTDFKSYHFSAVRYDSLLTTQLNIYGGPIADGLAYTGLPKFAVKNRDLRRANYSYWEADDKNYTYTQERHPYEIENFSQPHFELLNEFKINNNITLNNALFLVLGTGYFDYDGSWADTTYFRITNEFGFHPTQNPGNALIRAMVENKQWGWIPRLSINHPNGEFIIGGEVRVHRSLHWGAVNYAEGLPAEITKDYKYYSYRGGNDIMNFFLRENYLLRENINLLIEAQAAYHNYKIYDESYLKNEFTLSNLFFNPRVGINYKINSNWNSYFSFAKVSREPRLVNYYDAAESSGGATPQFEIASNGKYDFTKPLVKPETMYDFEFGTSYSFNQNILSANAYYMVFDNEIVKKGQLDRFGQPVTGNMDHTIHYGVELSAQLKMHDDFTVILNGSLSKNYIGSGSAYYFNGNLSQYVPIQLEGNSISGFPSATFNAIAKYSIHNLLITAELKYVGELFTDNYGSKLNSYKKLYPDITSYSDNRVDPYFMSNIFVSYNFDLNPITEALQLFFQVNNVFDNLYAAYGIGGEYFPAADRNFNFGMKIKL